MLECGADADACNDQNETPLHTACRNYEPRVLRVLLKYAKRLDIYSISDLATPLRHLVENLSRTQLKMACAVLQAGADPNVSFNQEFTGFETVVNIRSLIGQDSAFDFLLRVPRHRFEFNIKHNDTTDTRFLSDEQNSNRSLNSPPPISIQRFLNFIQMMIKSGYRLTPREARLFRESWLREYLVSTSPSYTAYMDNFFTIGLTKPATLKDLSRIAVRRHLHKPLRQSVRVLDIPTQLKVFLNLDLID